LKNYCVKKEWQLSPTSLAKINDNISVTTKPGISVNAQVTYAHTHMYTQRRRGWTAKVKV